MLPALVSKVEFLFRLFLGCDDIFYVVARRGTTDFSNTAKELVSALGISTRSLAGYTRYYQGLTTFGVKHTSYYLRVLERSGMAIWATHFVWFQHVLRWQVRLRAHSPVGVSGLVRKQERVIALRHPFGWLLILPPLHHSSGGFT
jgi:hypothetical protein